MGSAFDYRIPPGVPTIRHVGKATGLGLFLVREILTMTGIAIQETGTHGRGARFEIVVPRGCFREP